MGKNAMKRCFLDAVWLLHTWTNNGCGWRTRLKQVKTFKIPVWVGTGHTIPHLQLKSSWQLMVPMGKKSVFLSDIATDKLPLIHNPSAVHMQAIPMS